MKFHENKLTPLSRRVSLKLRFNFFDAVITPTVLFGLATTSLTMAHLWHLSLVWRRMLRSTTGWFPVPKGDWRSVMVTMTQKLAIAERLFHLKSWTEKDPRNQGRLAARIAANGHK